MKTKFPTHEAIGPVTRRRLAALALLSLAGAPGARAELLVYEPFAYPDGLLNGQSGALGTTGAWESHDSLSATFPIPQTGWRVHQEGDLSGVGLSGSNTAIDPLGFNAFDGTVDNLPTSGGYAGLHGAEDVGDTDPHNGEPGRWMDAHIGLAPQVTATFAAGTTTWFSFVSVRGWDRNEESPQFMIGTDFTPNAARQFVYNTTDGGNAIGGGGAAPRYNMGDVLPSYFAAGVPHISPGGYLGGVLGGHNGILLSNGSNPDSDGVLENAVQTMVWVENDAAGGFGAPNIVVGKIEWDADTGGEDVISVVRFLEADTLSEAAFDALITAQPALSSRNWPSNKPNLDQSQFDTLNFSGTKYFVDEIRIATTFGAVIGEGGHNTFPLTITPATAPATGYLLAWATQEGMLYRLRSSTDLSAAIATWNIVEQDIPAAQNTRLVNPAEPRLFYAVEEYPVPPVTLLNASFDENDGAFTVVTTGGTPWEWGAPISPDAGGGGVTTDNGGTGKCWGTDIGDPGGYDAGTSTSLLSPVIDLTAVAGATLTFAQALDIAPTHTLEVYVTDAAGTAIGGPIHTSTPDTDTTKANWKASPAIAIAGGQPVRLEWRFIGDGNGTFLGAYIDDVRVTTP
jgi:hypothetical protein